MSAHEQADCRVRAIRDWRQWAGTGCSSAARVAAALTAAHCFTAASSNARRLLRRARRPVPGVPLPGLHPSGGLPPEGLTPVTLKSPPSESSQYGDTGLPLRLALLQAGIGWLAVGRRACDGGVLAAALLLAAAAAQPSASGPLAAAGRAVAAAADAVPTAAPGPGSEARPAALAPLLRRRRPPPADEGVAGFEGGAVPWPPFFFRCRVEKRPETPHYMACKAFATATPQGAKSSCTSYESLHY
jgi:hypothetical protein